MSNPIVAPLSSSPRELWRNNGLLYFYGIPMRSSEDYGALKVYVIVLNGTTDMINKTISCHCNGGILGWTLLRRLVSSLVNDGLSNADIALYLDINEPYYAANSHSD